MFLTNVKQVEDFFRGYFNFNSFEPIFSVVQMIDKLLPNIKNSKRFIKVKVNSLALSLITSSHAISADSLMGLMDNKISGRKVTAYFDLLQNMPIPLDIQHNYNEVGKIDWDDLGEYDFNESLAILTIITRGMLSQNRIWNDDKIMAFFPVFNPEYSNLLKITDLRFSEGKKITQEITEQGINSLFHIIPYIVINGRKIPLVVSFAKDELPAHWKHLDEKKLPTNGNHMWKLKTPYVYYANALYFDKPEILNKRFFNEQISGVWTKNISYFNNMLDSFFTNVTRSKEAFPEANEIIKNLESKYKVKMDNNQLVTLHRLGYLVYISLLKNAGINNIPVIKRTYHTMYILNYNQYTFASSEQRIIFDFDEYFGYEDIDNVIDGIMNQLILVNNAYPDHQYLHVFTESPEIDLNVALDYESKEEIDSSNVKNIEYKIEELPL